MAATTRKLLDLLMDTVAKDCSSSGVQGHWALSQPPAELRSTPGPSCSPAPSGIFLHLPKGPISFSKTQVTSMFEHPSNPVPLLISNFSMALRHQTVRAWAMGQCGSNSSLLLPGLGCTEKLLTPEGVFYFLLITCHVTSDEEILAGKRSH